MTSVSRDQMYGLGHQRGDGVFRGIRGLLHDLGHQLMTLSLLAESIRADADVSPESAHRMELVRQETFRAIDMITDHMSVTDPDGQDADPDPVDIRDLAGQAAQLAELAYGATVVLLPGRPTFIGISPCTLWRVLSNLVDNAARSAGPGGRVEISVRQETDTVIDILDDGPGFGRAPGGTEGLGLSVVRQLVETADGRLEVADRPEAGTRVRVVFCRQRDHAMVPACAGTWH
jgi:signal transduction histidine kinase